MRIQIPTISLIWATVAAAQNAVDSLSFGHKGGISPNSFAIPGWSMLGDGHMPQLLSDKVILTPPYGGGKRGALWTEAKNILQQWVGTLEFRAGGVDHGQGNLALWYVKDGNTAVSTSSIYTAGKFDGLALVVDMNGGIQKIRGFLNDGTTDFSKHPHVDSLAFGHCDYNYRNLGRPSKLQIKAVSGGLEVLIDDRQCFSTDKVSLPSSDYGFGITAASADPPDSFEVFKFELASASSPQQAAGQASPPLQEQNVRMRSPPADSGTSNQALTQRIEALEKSISSLVSDINHNIQTGDSRYQEILNLLKTPPSSGGTANQNAMINNLESRLSSLDRTLSTLSGSISSDLKSTLNHDEKFAKIQQQLQQTHEGLTNHLPTKMREYVQNHTPRIGFIVFSFMAFQSCCLAVLLWQKWRKSTMPKKYL